MKRVYIEDWLATEVCVSPSPVDLRTEAAYGIIDDDVKIPPELTLDDIGGLTRAGYLLYNSQGNPFVEKSDFYFWQSKVAMTAVTQLKAARAVCLRGRLWTSGVVDVWVNGKRHRRIHVLSGMCPGAQEIRLDLDEGMNTVFVREQCGGMTPVRELFGIELDNPPADLQVVLPGGEHFRRMTENVRSWLASLAAAPDGHITASAAPPCPVTLCTATGTAEHVREADHTRWPAGGVGADMAPTADTLVVHADFMGQRLTRRFEFIENTRVPKPSGGDREAIRNWQLRRLAESGQQSIRGVMPSMARRYLGISGAADDGIFLEALKDVDRHPDCADFYLVGMLRMALTMPLTEELKGALRDVSLRFRYWLDEDGTDGMCFTTENHSLLFHACQLLAGKLYPDDVFSLSGRTGARQAEIAFARCVEWADKRILDGFDEFLSSTYIPLTLAAMLIVHDFCGDPELRGKYKKLCDTVFRQLAMHSFDGVTVGPQGRVYRNILRPHESGTQAMLAYADPAAVPSTGAWMTHILFSDYRPPEDIPAVARASQDTRYTQSGVEIVLYKTNDYMLTSLALPSQARGYLPGQNGGQQHIGHAALARDCHIFINHAGCAFDFGHSRPGYWYGNGIMPAQRQEKNLLLTLYNIPDQYPFDVTHAFWPAHTLEETRIEEHWAFARRGNGYIALWCSGKLEPYSHTLQGKELRARGRLTGWVTYCLGAGDVSSFEAFIDRARRLCPCFDKEKLTLGAGEAVLVY